MAPLPPDPCPSDSPDSHLPCHNSCPRRSVAGIAIIDVSPGGRVGFATERARELLAKYFPETRMRRLPDVVMHWFAPAASHALPQPPPWVTERGGEQLVVRLTGTHRGHFHFLLEEKASAGSPKRLEMLGLTPREAEVLFWIAQGKTAADISTILGCRIATVNKHTERIFVKLGVETRGAAGYLANELLR